MRVIVLVVLAMMMPAVAVAQERGPDQERREALEQRIRGRFLAQVSQRLGLSQEQRVDVQEVLSESADARRDLVLESQALRIDLMQAVRDDDAEMSRFESILERLEAVRAREREIEQAEEAALAEILDPRQRAIFLMLRMQLNDRIRQMRGARGGPGMGGGPGAPEGGVPFL